MVTYASAIFRLGDTVRGAYFLTANSRRALDCYTADMLCVHSDV